MGTTGSHPQRKGSGSCLIDGLRARMHLVRYAGFAIAAIVINLLSQNLMLAIFSGLWFGIYAAIFVGNGAGLLFKYIADKHWVFDDGETTLSGNSRKFALYATFGALTTVIFWGFELAFHYAFDNQFMTNVGAVCGLCLGYLIKYNLDKHLTFSHTSAKGLPEAGKKGARPNSDTALAAPDRFLSP